MLKRFESADTEDYRACAWMTEELKRSVAEQVRYMLLALTKGRFIEYSKCDLEKPGFPFAPHDTWIVSVGSTFAAGETKEEAECKMLGLILRDGTGFPLFRNANGTGLTNKGDQGD